jgi:multiple sugar transport system substrate-binding protein
MRPAVPQWAELAELMGSVFHDMLSGNLTPEAATALAQTRALQLFASARP